MTAIQGQEHTQGRQRGQYQRPHRSLVASRPGVRVRWSPDSYQIEGPDPTGTGQETRKKRPYISRLFVMRNDLCMIRTSSDERLRNGKRRGTTGSSEESLWDLAEHVGGCRKRLERAATDQ